MLSSPIVILTFVALCSAVERNSISFPRVSVNESISGKLAGVDAHLSIASQILETARKKLHADLDELCGKGTHGGKPVDCSDIYRNGYREDGIYEVWPMSRVGKTPIKVYCDMTKHGGGWTVIERRGDFRSPTDYFYRDWANYRTGFGELSKDFWIGNDNLFALTNLKKYQLRVDLEDWEGKSAYATYDEFWISDESLNYTLHVAKYKGTAGDSFKAHNGHVFSTKDRDPKGCAVQYKGAWWYYGCYNVDLNGFYLRGKQLDRGGVEWYHFKGHNYSLKDAIMKIRPNDFKDNGFQEN